MCLHRRYELQSLATLRLEDLNPCRLPFSCFLGRFKRRPMEQPKQKFRMGLEDSLLEPNVLVEQFVHLLHFGAQIPGLL